MFDYIRKEQARAKKHALELQKIHNSRRTPIQVAQVKSNSLVNSVEKNQSALQQPITQNKEQLHRPQPILHKNSIKPVVVHQKIPKKYMQTEIEKTKTVQYNKQKSLPPSSACAA